MATPEEAERFIQDLAKRRGHMPGVVMSFLQNASPEYYELMDSYRETMEGLASDSIKTCVFNPGS